MIPDTWPIVGNLDEATVLLILLKCLGWYGIDLDWLLRRPNDKPPAP